MVSDSPLGIGERTNDSRECPGLVGLGLGVFSMEEEEESDEEPRRGGGRGHGIIGDHRLYGIQTSLVWVSFFRMGSFHVASLVVLSIAIPYTTTTT